MDNETIFEMRPIGYVSCPDLKSKDDYDKKPKGQKVEGRLILNENLAEGLDEIESFDHVWIIWAFSRNIGKGYKLKVYPRPDPNNHHGLFVTRSPYRPNPIAISCVKVIGHEKNILIFENGDIFDGTPVLDIKPYIPSSDSRPDSHAGWISDLGL